LEGYQGGEEYLFLGGETKEKWRCEEEISS
jgi:hypothetical protein